MVRVTRRGELGAAVQVARVDSEGLAELFVCVRPSRDGGGIEVQARSIYETLFETLDAHGAGPQDVITEKIFFSDVDRQFRELEAIRLGAYRSTVDEVGCAPATNFLHQPPAHPGRLCELQAYAVLQTGADPVGVRCVKGMPGLPSGKVIEHRGMRHVYLMNLTKNGYPEDNLPFVRQTERMFKQAESSLREVGASFRDVIRTWIYIADIERDYDAFNPVRTAFFERQGVGRIPASTGIQGATFPRMRGCTMDLYALLADRPVEIEVMHAPTMEEAMDYGSAFSRGMAVTYEGRTTAYVSGTASIDTEGRVVHVGDIEGQVRRMLANVEALLRGSGATLDDAVEAITYLKRPEYLETFYRVWDERGLPGNSPNTVSVADICRPEWLCEIEAIAMFPADGR